MGTLIHLYLPSMFLNVHERVWQQFVARYTAFLARTPNDLRKHRYKDAAVATIFVFSFLLFLLAHIRQMNIKQHLRI